ncbi:hypothetical protein N9954_05600 [Maribacter sp.]|nr:hypothetical protein [Maribacter sp.]
MKKIKSRFEGNLPQTSELLRLHRANNDLVQLGRKLNSYTCEPCTESLYEQIQTLRSRLEQLKSTNNEVISSVKRRKSNLSDVGDVVKKQLRDFHELQKGVFDYTRAVKSLH